MSRNEEIKTFSIRRYIPIIILLTGLILFFSLKLYRYLSFQSIKEHQTLLSTWTKTHFIYVTLGFIGIYTLLLAISFPSAGILSIIGGFLFGIYIGSIYSIIGATLGSTILFGATKTAFGDLIVKKAKPSIKKFKAGFQKNAINYLLFLRFAPIFPFWLVTVSTAILNVRLKTFIFATIFGMIPGTIVYASLGNGMTTLFKEGKTPNIEILFTPDILLPLLGLALLSLVPVVYRHLKNRSTAS